MNEHEVRAQDNAQVNSTTATVLDELIAQTQ